MTRFIANGRFGRVIAAALFGALFHLVGAGPSAGPAWSQAAGQFRGVAPWQAQRAIKDYMNRFIVAQKKFGIAKLGNTDFSVRVKIEGLTRVENKDRGTMWVAQFSGAILPRVSRPNAEQGYAHAILKIQMSPTGGVEVVVNEGQGVWTMRQKTSILWDDLPEDPGGWKQWGGPGDEPEPRNPIAGGTPTLDHPVVQGSSGGPRSNPMGDPRIRALADEVAALGAKVAELRKQGASPALQKAQTDWQEAQRKYMEAIRAAGR
ncbi:MAG: hypothetical protein OEL76_10890 [Siculibacillus sp.]|nr:hypothetical protein [Siculibacillus sp.]